MFGGAWRNLTVMQRVCGVCLGPLPAGRVRLWCGDACRQAAFRDRHGASVAVPTIPAKVALRPHTVYECGGCGVRVLFGAVGSPSTIIGITTDPNSLIAMARSYHSGPIVTQPAHCKSNSTLCPPGLIECRTVLARAFWRRYGGCGLNYPNFGRNVWANSLLRPQ